MPRKRIADQARPEMENWSRILNDSRRRDQQHHPGTRYSIAYQTRNRTMSPLLSHGKAPKPIG